VPRTPGLPPDEDLIEYVLDQGRECECCRAKSKCDWILLVDGHKDPPECTKRDFSELLSPRLAAKIYKEDHDL
jgi:hypothetical protein